MTDKSDLAVVSKIFLKILKEKPKNKKEEQTQLNAIKFYLKTKYK